MRFVMALGMVVVLISGVAFAQQYATATLSGLVTAPRGAVVPGAS